MWEWLKTHPTTDLTIEVILFLVLVGILVFFVLAVAFAFLWICRLFKGWKVFIAKAIPESRSIKAGSAEIHFEDNVQATLAKVVSEVDQLSQSVLRLYAERNGGKDAQQQPDDS